MKVTGSKLLTVRACSPVHSARVGVGKGRVVSALKAPVTRTKGRGGCAAARWGRKTRPALRLCRWRDPDRAGGVGAESHAAVVTQERRGPG